MIMGAAVLSSCATTVTAEEDQAAGQQNAASAKSRISGEEIFRREWLVNDPRSHGGDGLGPVFNESSCVACHNQGGVGGAGPIDKNVELLTLSMLTQQQLIRQVRGTEQPTGANNPQTVKEIERQHQEMRDAIVKMHPGFRNANTAVMHRFGVDTKHEAWRRQIRSGRLFVAVTDGRESMIVHGDVVPEADLAVPVNSPFNSSGVGALPGQTPSMQPPQQAFDTPLVEESVDQPAVQTAQAAETNAFPALGRISQEIQHLKRQARSGMASVNVLGMASVQHSQRNTTALFGAGLIDAIPATAIEAAAKRKYDDFPRVTGRVHRLQDGRIGRFGWKAQEASLYDFTMTACAVEVGLHVPDHPQSPAPYNPDVKPAGFDLTQTEADALVGYLKHLPAPVQNRSSHSEVARQLDEGERLFESVGCAACHMKQMGDVDGLFSDLLLHDMGPDLGAVGHYGVPSPPPVDPVDVPLAGTKPSEAKPKPVPPTSQEWRTPPLWGVRDSAPYLHDGRASTLEQAIAFHGGEAADARLRFFFEPPERRQKILAFLKSLVAPETAGMR